MNLCILSPGMGAKLELENVNDGTHIHGGGSTEPRAIRVDSNEVSGIKRGIVFLFFLFCFGVYFLHLRRKRVWIWGSVKNWWYTMYGMGRDSGKLECTFLFFLFIPYLEL